MANKLDPMDLKQIISLHLDGLSNRKIAGLLGIGRNTVNTYMQHFKACSRPLEELLELSNPALERLFPMRSTIDNERYNRLMRYFEKINQARNHPGFTFLYHYREYRQQEPAGYSYTQFMEHYHRKYGDVKGSVKLEHEAGKEVFIDFAGKKLFITDKVTGEQQPVEVFIAILPCSQYTYVEACRSQKRADLIRCMGHSLSFFGGAPKAIVSDNLKSAVTRASKYEADINRSFKDFTRHYNCVANPTRSYAPQDKALVENAVHLVYQRIYYPLRAMTFFSLEELNAEIRKRLEDYNDLLFQRKEASRKELFQSVERQYLKPLPATPYELKDYRRAKVQKMGYVYFSPDKNYYSVPYRYIGKSTQIHYTQSMVEVYYNHQRIALHQRSRARGHYITNKDHLSSTHKAYTQWGPEYFKKLARKHGQYVEDLVSGILTGGDYPEINYKRAMGVVHLHKSYGSHRLNKACQRAVDAGIYSYKRLKNILENNQDQQETDHQELNNYQTHIPRHANTRGAAYYQ
jgi:transposase